ncbi:glycosyltransferase [Rathayibacter soli]|uniref:glycosyltransferase n=1 Tax=Rathayibacter soli TaxID=3144168 RepID=UPI0027E4CC43|nr:glycosyltransferase [Glaciibacter superstes]
MRVLRISHSATVPAWRGRERALRARGVTLTLLAARRWHAGGAPVALERDNADDAVPVATVGHHPALFLYDPRPLWAALGQQWDVIDIHEEPFALATAELLLLRAMRRSTAPVVLYTAQNITKRYPVPFRWMERAALRTARGISACNAEAAAISVAKGFAGRPRVIPLGVDLAEFESTSQDTGDPAPVRESSNGTGGAPIAVGFLGRLVPEKGLGVLLQAAAAEPRLHLRIAGVGPMATAIVADAARLGIANRIQLLGAVAPEQVPGFYRSVDVLAVPSVPTVRWTEQFGRVAIEAMASGVPVVSSDAGALPDVVGGAGIVVPQGDPIALRAALVEAAGPQRERLRAAGYQRAQECTWDAVADQYVNLYRSVARLASVGANRAARLNHAAGSTGTENLDADNSAVENPGVEIIVVAYGAVGLLRAALAPVAHLTVTVVDNSSLPEIAALCTELGVRYVDAGRNAGFAAGVNLALADRLVPGADVLLLNPDARFTPDQVTVLQNALRAENDLASVGPAQRDDDGRSARVEWPFPTPGNAWLEAVGLGRFQTGARYAIGSVLLLRAEALDQVGGLDERFFLYAEEADWAQRANRLGWRHRAVHDAHAVHVGAGTSGDSRRRDLHFFASQERYYRKHFGAAGWQCARSAGWFGATVRGMLLPGVRRAQAWRRAALYARGPVRAESRLPAPPAPRSY